MRHLLLMLLACGCGDCAGMGAGMIAKGGAAQPDRAAAYVPTTVPVWPLPAHPQKSPAALPFTRENAAPYWHPQRRQTEAWARQMIRWGGTQEDVDAVMLELWTAELDYYREPRIGDTPFRWEIVKTWKTWKDGYPKP